MEATGANSGSRSISGSTVLLVFLIGYFLLAGLLLVPYPGVENDEALFSNGIYAAGTVTEAHMRLFGKPVATMIMSYIGALKAWVYAPIFAVWAPSAWSLRVPVLVIGAVAVWLFFLFLRRAAGQRAALFGAALLATDVTFLLTTTFDWGPVAFQHLLFLGGMVLVLRFYQEDSEAALAGAFLLFGLLVWDKALALWMLSATTVAGVIVYHRQMWRVFTWRRLAVAAGACLLGSLPFVAYNLATGFRTFQDKHYTLADLPLETVVMRGTLDGSVMAGFLIDYASPIPPPANAWGVRAASLGVAAALHHPRYSLLPLALVLALVGGVLAWWVKPDAVWLPGRAGLRTRGPTSSSASPESRGAGPGGPARSGTSALHSDAASKARLLAFFAIAFAIAWFQMIITAEAGASAHHTILVWPHVIGFVAVGLAALADRFPRAGAWTARIVVLAVVVSNVLLWNTYFAGLIRFGPGPMWSDATYPLADRLREAQPGIVYAADWGMGDTLRMFLQGRIPMGNAIEPFYRDTLDPVERAHVVKRLEQPGAVFVSYADGRDTFPKAKRMVDQVARESGFRRESVATVRDRRGRPVFEIYRYVERPEGDGSATDG